MELKKTFPLNSTIYAFIGLPEKLKLDLFLKATHEDRKQYQKKYYQLNAERQKARIFNRGCIKDGHPERCVPLPGSYNQKNS